MQPKHLLNPPRLAEVVRGGTSGIEIAALRDHAPMPVDNFKEYVVRVGYIRYGTLQRRNLDIFGDPAMLSYRCRNRQRPTTRGFCYGAETQRFFR
ncbi:hypothetical protein GCM10007862_13620 [Dyella lipolytica]|nr:hypothetical protein GCM10007862_13620 [Dyella lipolytica]